MGGKDKFQYQTQLIRGKRESEPECARHPTAGDEPRELTSRGEGRGVPMRADFKDILSSRTSVRSLIDTRFIPSIEMTKVGFLGLSWRISEACPEWCLDKEILEKNARNKIRVHQCLPIVKKYWRSQSRLN